MSSKDEILVIEQAISEIDKRLFDLRSKLNQCLKQIPKEEESLASIKIKIEFSKNAVKHMKLKSTDLVDISEFKQLTHTLNDQLDSHSEVSANLAAAKKARQAISEMITFYESVRESKRMELNDYGQIRQFIAPRKLSKVPAIKGSNDGKNT